MLPETVGSANMGRQHPGSIEAKVVSRLSRPVFMTSDYSRTIRRPFEGRGVQPGRFADNRGWFSKATTTAARKRRLGSDRPTRREPRLHGRWATPSANQWAATMGQSQSAAGQATRLNNPYRSRSSAVGARCFQLRLSFDDSALSDDGSREWDGDTVSFRWKNDGGLRGGKRLRSPPTKMARVLSRRRRTVFHGTARKRVISSIETC